MVTLVVLFKKLKMKEKYPEITIVAGNVATAGATRALFELVLTSLKLVLDQDQFVQHVS